MTRRPTRSTLLPYTTLFRSANQLAGEVKAKANRRNTRSDWMAIERDRGISVMTSVMTFDYGGRVFNLLDTPGDRKSTRLNSSHKPISYADFCLKKKNNLCSYSIYEEIA